MKTEIKTKKEIEDKVTAAVKAIFNFLDCAYPESMKFHIREINIRHSNHTTYHVEATHDGIDRTYHFPRFLADGKLKIVLFRGTVGMVEEIQLGIASQR